MDKKVIAEFIWSQYGLQCEIEQLDSYIDYNFLATAENGDKYILKLSSDLDSLEFLQDQNTICHHLTESTVTNRQFPSVIQSSKGEDIIRMKFPEEKSRKVRLLRYLQGKFLANVEHTSALLYDVGAFLGEMNGNLKDYQSAHIECRNLLWDLQNFSETAKYAPLIEGIEIQRLVYYFLLQFNEAVRPEFSCLRKQIIHNDANDWNILVNDDRVSGIIDFGDMVYSYTVNELAIALTYLAMGKEDPIHSAIEVVRGYHSKFKLQEDEVDLIYYLVGARLSLSLCMSAYTKKKNPANEYITISEKPAIDLLRKWIRISPVHATNMFRKACGFAGKVEVDHTPIINKRNAFISSSLSLSYDQPIRMVKAAFQYMYDDTGNTYLDCVNNICHVGHCHPRVVEAGQKQMASLNTNTRYLYDVLNRYAEKLCDTFPDGLSKVFFVNSGSAATDLALRLARNHTKQEDVIVVDHAYHGNVTSAIEVSPYKFEGKGGNGCVPTTHKIQIPDTYRGQYREDHNDPGRKYANELDPVIQDIHQNGKRVAALICESIIGCGGQVMLPPGYLDEVYIKIRDQGGVCIADEVQVGFGRVGTAFWGFELQNVVPDIVILGKPMGNGHPLSAVVTTEAIAASFENGMEFFSSFGGNPVSCAIGEAVLDVLFAEDLQKNAQDVGNHIKSGLVELKLSYPIIGDIRGSGLFIGIEFVLDDQTREPAPVETKHIVEQMKERKILLSIDGPFHNVIKFKPPMVFSPGDADHLLTNLEEVLKVL